MEKIINHKATKGPTKRVPSLASEFKPKIGSKPIIFSSFSKEGLEDLTTVLFSHCTETND